MARVQLQDALVLAPAQKELVGGVSKNGWSEEGTYKFISLFRTVAGLHSRFVEQAVAP